IGGRLYDFYSSTIYGGPDPTYLSGYPYNFPVRLSSRRGIVVPHPVLVQAGFGLEPLAGEAQVDGAPGRRPPPPNGR
ncbi:MAG: hypothetical protein ACEQSU_10650, partial [Microgenomates group bacterium]